MNELTTLEQSRLIELEGIIKAGLKTFIEVGFALMEIRDSRLYRQQFKTYEEYCDRKWLMTRRRAYQFIDAASVVLNVNHGTQIPENERQVRPLTSLEPEAQREVWETAVATAPNGKVTAAHVEQTKREYMAPLWSADGADSDPEPLKDIGPSFSQNGHGREVLHSSKTNEWYTPVEYIAAVHEALGCIDLDPASCDLANQTVKANEFYTETDDGLSFQWHGRVFLNPPYGKENGKSNQAVWSQYLIDQHEAGNVEEAILLVNATPGNKWFAPLWDYPICFVDHRIEFYNDGEETSGATHSNCFVYLGDDKDRFADVFSRFGVVAVRYES